MLELIKGLNESIAHETQEVYTDLVNINENCEFILEADSREVTASAHKFLTKLAADLKQSKVTHPETKIDSHKFSILAVLSMLPHSAKISPLEKISVRKYLANDSDAGAAELSAAERTIANSLSKLHTHDNVSGKDIKKHFVDMFHDNPKKLHSEVVKLAKKYSKVHHVLK